MTQNVNLCKTDRVTPWSRNSCRISCRESETNLYTTEFCHLLVASPKYHKLSKTFSQLFISFSHFVKIPIFHVYGNFFLAFPVDMPDILLFSPNIQRIPTKINSLANKFDSRKTRRKSECDIESG